ncbi:MAG: Unknown protein [uncultured Sulfurovum sp.]|uniref:Lipoprotein n=1 Tax=uncultured Sulfurovum sp. TaxID=269237 RepID=A0A6S6T1V2_9BACT|nr:MAG: Unknown protein [uncultured Sulfurovum sp.]
MKKTLLLLTMPLFFMLTACTGNTLSHKFIDTKAKNNTFVEKNEEGTGGNPEVYIAHQCLKGKSAESCLQNLFLNKKEAYIESYEVIKLAARGNGIEKATITFEGDDLFLLYLDTSNIETPLSVNINLAEMSSDHNSVLFMLPVEEINEEIIVKDKQGNIVLQYQVDKK